MRFFRGLTGAVTILLAGLIWDHTGPEFVFLTVIALDVLIRIPLLIGTPETLRMKKYKR